jgi:hypothetical protein
VKEVLFTSRPHERCSTIPTRKFAITEFHKVPPRQAALDFGWPGRSATAFEADHHLAYKEKGTFRLANMRRYGNCWMHHATSIWVIGGAECVTRSRPL